MNNLAFIATNEFDAFAGSELLWTEAASALAAQGCEVSVNAPRWNAEPDRISRLREQELVRFETRPTSLPISRRVLAKAGIIGAESFFAQYREDYIRKIRPELLVISQGGLVDGIGWMEACTALGVPFVVIVHLVADALWPSPGAAARSIAIYPFASKVYFVSEENRISAGRQLGMVFANSAIVRNPFNVSFDTQIEWPPETGEWKLACVGRLGVEHKGQDLLVEVLSSRKWRDRNLSVTLFGQGHHRKYLERLIAIKSCKNIIFGGYTNEISEVWRKHHAAIMPSRYEGLPIALVEAMLCNRMAIVTNVGGNSELIRDGATGFVASAPNVDSVDAALEKAWLQRGEWESMGKKAGTSVRQTMPNDSIQEFIKNLKSLIV